MSRQTGTSLHCRRALAVRSDPDAFVAPEAYLSRAGFHAPVHAYLNTATPKSPRGAGWHAHLVRGVYAGLLLRSLVLV